MKIAVLALQGAFIEHCQMLDNIGVEHFLVRNISDWYKQKDGLIIPGGESTTMLNLLNSTKLYNAIKESIINDQLPVFGTCAGLIMLDNEHLSTMNIKVKRNAYGRQSGSFSCQGHFEGISTTIPMTFIRAPYIEAVADNVTILSKIDGHIVAAQQQKQLVTAFHPELTTDCSVHNYFLNMCKV